MYDKHLHPVHLFSWLVYYKKYYYGVRYAKNCHPTDLWQRYFTSSITVKELRKTLGEPDIIQVRHTFTSKERAIIWETRVLRTMKVVQRSDFLNKNDAQAPPINNRIMTQGTKDKISMGNKGKNLTDEHKQKLRNARATQLPTFLGKRHSNKTKQKLREANLGKKASDDTRQKMSKAQSGERHWAFGNSMPVAVRNKISQSKKGIPMSDETKQKISNAAKSKPVLVCPHCASTGKTLSMSRHHFNNCKYRKE